VGACTALLEKETALLKELMRHFIDDVRKGSARGHGFADFSAGAEHSVGFGCELNVEF